MIVVLEAMIVGAFILPAILIPKKRSRGVIDTNTTGARYAVDCNGYLVKL